jgi:dihydrofolate synthase/folylpolyglutamate synthase
LKRKFEVLHVVLGVVNDKDLNEILPLFPKSTLLFLQTKYSSWTQALNYSKSFNIRPKGEVYNSVSEAYNQTKSASKSDFIYVGGHLVVAEIYNFFVFYLQI